MGRGGGQDRSHDRQIGREARLGNRISTSAAPTIRPPTTSTAPSRSPNISQPASAATAGWTSRVSPMTSGEKRGRAQMRDRKSVVEGKRGAVRVDLGGRRI